MLYSIKSLIFVLAIAWGVFRLAKPIALRFMSEEDFSTRRRVWFVLNAACFLSPNFWIYALVAVPMLIWANRRDSNSVALYLVLLHVIPPVEFPIPLLGNNGLFSIGNYRLLALFTLLPAVMNYRKYRKKESPSGFGMMDVLLLAAGVLQVALYTPPDLPHHFIIPDSPSNALRRGFLYMLDIYLLYYAISRLCRSREKLVDAAAAFCLGSAILAAMGMFERLKGWLLYVEIPGRWGSPAAFYLLRGGSVRAQVSTGHSIALGFLVAVAFGLWLYLKSHIKGRWPRIGTTLLLWGGLFGAFSRGGWLGATTIYFAFLAAGSNAASRLVKGGALAFAVACLIAMTPLGDQISDMLPKSGQPADIYRSQLAARGWEIVFAHPIFGDRYPWAEMEDLRQGEGIIDIVNTYLGVGLNYGLTGLFCFLGVILLGMIRVYIRARELSKSDPDLSLFGISLVACIAGTLIMIDSCSFILGCQKSFYILVGLAGAYASLTTSPQQHSATRRLANTP